VYIKLSYNLSRATPVYVGGPPVKIRQESNIEHGDTSNVFCIEVVNHTGTHVDAPRHFSVNGKKISEIDIENFFFQKPVCVDLPKNESELITSTDLEPYALEIAKADFLLIKTGFAKYRNTDMERYCHKNPGFSVEAARYLINNFGNLRAMGMDTISFAATRYPEEGIEAHKILLNNPEKPLLLVEDLNLEFPLKKIKRVMVIPLFVEEFDSSFCTVIAEI